MRFACTRFIIDPVKPVRQAGFSQQVDPVSKVHDHLHGRLIGLDDGTSMMVFLSVDSIGLTPTMASDLAAIVHDAYGPQASFVESATHTHFAGDPRNDVYAAQLMGQFESEIRGLSWQEVGAITVSHQHMACQAVGASRISGHPTDNIFLDLITLWQGGRRLATFIVYNCHPTIQNGDTPYFSSEYPGYVMEQLTQLYPGEFFTFMQGADGDVSSRFTRPFQNYDAVVILGDRLKDEIIELRHQPAGVQPLRLSYESTVLPLEHEFGPIDVSHLPDGISPREKETIMVGQKVREELSHHLETLAKQVTLSCVGLGPVRILFAPNELFSSFIDCIDTSKAVLACYSNGYAPYVTDPDFKGLTYEKFTDTLTVPTKQAYKRILSGWGR